ncbi:MAG TPA: hypothetical protein VM260_20420 [Pirellula sp.]|nr:hypothetical protein [Pirellula sp.]
MKFAIADVLWTTIAAAMLRYGADGLIIAFALLIFLQITIPVGFLFAIIALADQRGQMLDFSTLPGWQSLKKIWGLSITCTVIVSALLFWYAGPSF